jgi:hypothetical protein
MRWSPILNNKSALKGILILDRNGGEKYNRAFKGMAGRGPQRFFQQQYGH